MENIKNTESKTVIKTQKFDDCFSYLCLENQIIQGFKRNEVKQETFNMTAKNVARRLG